MITSNKSILTIGMPVFNGASFLRQALDSVLAQNFKDFVLIISDNASTDATANIVYEYQSQDARISYHRQSKNLGATENFYFVARNIATPYFMWFASDDVMAQGFLETCITMLERDQDLGVAFTSICNIDSFGRVIRDYPNFNSYSGKVSLIHIAKFLLASEINGKANIIYGVYRASIISTALRAFGLPPTWGSDMNFVLACLTGGGLMISGDVLFMKRMLRDGDADAHTYVPMPTSPLEKQCPLSHFDEYKSSAIDAVRGSKFTFITAFIMEYRHRYLLRYRKALESRIFGINIIARVYDFLHDTLSAFRFAWAKAK